MEDVKYFLKGIMKMSIWIIGVVIWLVPMSIMLLWVVITMCGGQDKSVDEYTWADNWMRWFDKRNDDLWNW